MTPTPARLDDLRQRLAALRTRFAEVGGRAATAAAEVRASAAPAQALLDDLRETSADFDELRVALLEEASAFAGAPDPARIRTLKALGALVSALERVEAERARRTAWEAARENALGVLDRVMTLIHREDKDASALADGQAKARELHAALSAAEPADVERETTMLSEHIRPFVELITLADGWNQLDDERCSSLHDAITQNFGRPLALAALRGKLGHEGEIIDAPEPTGFVPAAGYAARGRDPIERGARAGRDAGAAARARGAARTSGRGDRAVVGRRAPRLGVARPARPGARRGGARHARAVPVPALGAAGEERRVRRRTSGRGLRDPAPAPREGGARVREGGAHAPQPPVHDARAG